MHAQFLSETDPRPRVSREILRFLTSTMEARAFFSPDVAAAREMRFDLSLRRALCEARLIIERVRLSR